MNSSKTTANATAGDVMTTDLVTVPLSATAREIERVLIETNVSGVGVTDASGRIVGILSWRDVMAYFAESTDRSPHDPHSWFRYAREGRYEEGTVDLPLDDAVTATDMMRTDLLCVDETTPLVVVGRRMVEWDVHRVLVRDADEFVSGIISTMDVLAALCQEAE